MMLRILMLPLLLFTLSMACMGQTFQYSRGWTNGKRATAISSVPGSLLSNSASHIHRNDDGFVEMYDIQDNERKLERCLIQLQRFVGNTLLHRAAAAAAAASTPFASTLSFNGNKNTNNNNNNDNSLYQNHHQSTELLDELNAAMSSAGAVEPNDYGKH